jgi:hypothetical protein
MSDEKIKKFWSDATADDVARVMAGETVEARFRDFDKYDWWSHDLSAWCKCSQSKWIDSNGSSWVFCQVYHEPSWHANKPDPGLGYRLLEKLPDEELKPGDEGWDMRNDKQWAESCNANLGTPQSEGIWYRRRIEPVEPKFAVGQTVRVIGPKVEPAWHWGREMDRYIGLVGVIRNSPLEDGSRRFYNLEGIGIWCFREDYLEPVEPEPKHYVLRVGDSVESPSGDRIKCVSPSVEQRHYALRASDTVGTPSGQTITITEKGFEVTK